MTNAQAIHKRLEEELSKDSLEEFYLDYRLSTQDIANLFDTSRGTIVRFFDKFGIQRRDRQAAARFASFKYKRENHPNWKGGRSISAGYVVVLKPDHPRADQHGYVREHILVWEKAHGQNLPKGWEIHHLNGLKTDNRPKNLVALPDKSHRRLIPAFQARIRQLERQTKELKSIRPLLKGG